MTSFTIANDNTVKPGDECWYRCVDYKDTSGRRMLGREPTVVHLRKLKVAKHTPKGVRLFKGEYGGDTRVVLHDTHKKFAYDNESDAIDAFIRRKNAQLWILRNQVRQATEALALVTNGTIKR